MTATPEISKAGIAAVEPLIRPHIRQTPVVAIDGADFGLASARITLKLELLQHSGSFKARGAFANLLLRTPETAGVAAASGGNHGAAVAYAAKQLGVKATIFVPEISSPAKVARIRDYGAELVIGGTAYADALAACDAYVAETGALSIHAYDAAETMLGAGSLGLELEKQAGEFDTVIAAIGGGGLTGGLAIWFGSDKHIVAVEPEAAPTFATALAAGAPADSPVGGIAADSLGARRIGDVVFPVLKNAGVKSVQVKDDAIAAAQRLLWDRLRIAAEPGAAAATAALLSGRYKPQAGERIAVVISGGNTNAVNFNP